MPPDVSSILRDVLRREGGGKYTDVPGDRGGPTKFGITLATLIGWRRRDNPKASVTADDVKALTEAEALDIYLAQYVRDPGFLVLPDPLMPILVDMAVNHGPTAAVRLLQRAVGAEVDGVMGPATRDLVQKLPTGRIRAALCAERQLYYATIVANDVTQAKFLIGWTRRNADFIRELVA